MTDTAVPEALAEIEISRMYYDGKILRKEESAAVPVVLARIPDPRIPLAEVEYSQGITRNIGNYESVKISVAIKLPTPVPEVAEAFTAAKKFVCDRVAAEAAEIAAFVAKASASIF
jgi:hypothetical protein